MSRYIKKPNSDERALVGATDREEDVKSAADKASEIRAASNPKPLSFAKSEEKSEDKGEALSTKKGA